MAPTYGGSSQPASDKPQRSSRPVSIADLLAKKTRGEKVTMVTAYDYPSAVLADAAGFDILLVGDSVANVVEELISNKNRRHQLAVAGATAIDGQGTGRLLDLING